MQQKDIQALYIITGCSKGIGKVLTDKLLQANNTYVVGISRTAVTAKARFKHIEADLSDWQSLVDKLNLILPDAFSFKTIVLINNAAWVGELKHIGNLDTISLPTAFTINSIAPAILMNAFVQKYESVAAERIVIIAFSMNNYRS